MVEKVSRAVAVKRFLQSGPDAREVKADEMLAFWKACSTEEKQTFAEQAAKALGVELKAE